MTITDPAYTPTYQPAYAPGHAAWPTPPRQRSRSGLLTFGALVVLAAIASLTAVAVGQHGKLVDARERTAAVTVQRDQASEDLTDTKAALARNRARLKTTKADLATCQLLVGFSQSMTSAYMWRLDSQVAEINGNFDRASDKNDDAVDAANHGFAIVEAAGYDTMGALFDACDQGNINA